MSLQSSGATPLHPPPRALRYLVFLTLLFAIALARAEEPAPDPAPVEQPAAPAPVPVEPTVPSEGVEAEAGGSVEGGVEGAVEGGVLGGVLSNTPWTADSPRVLHWSDVEVKKRIDPKYPAAARKDRIEGRCGVRIFIDGKGVPSRVEPTNCPEVFREATVEAAMKWRFYPYKIDGVAHEAQFVLMVNYVLGDDE